MLSLELVLTYMRIYFNTLHIVGSNISLYYIIHIHLVYNIYNRADPSPMAAGLSFNHSAVSSSLRPHGLARLPVCGILQARILESVAIGCSRITQSLTARIWRYSIMYFLGNRDYNFCIIPIKSNWVIVIIDNSEIF